MTRYKYTLPEGFIPELGATVRTCIDCGCLVSGGPTRCKSCVREIEKNAWPWYKRVWRLLKPTGAKKG